MKRFSMAVLLFLTLHTSAQPPKALPKPVTEIYFGLSITDPYRHLEDLSDSSVVKWYRDQNAYAKEQLSKLPYRQKIMPEIISFAMSMNFSKKQPLIITDNYMIYYNVINPAKSVFEYHLINRNTMSDTVLFRSNDPAIMDTSYQLRELRISPDEQYLCLIGNKKDGSENQCERFYHILTMTIPADIVIGEFLRWMPDSRSVAVRNRVTTDTKSDSLYVCMSTEVYKIGDKKKIDVFSCRSSTGINLDPRLFTRITTHPKSSYVAGLTLSASGYYHTIYYAPSGDYQKMSSSWKPILFPRDSVTDVEGNNDIIIFGDHIYYKSSLGNSNYTLRRVHIPSGKKEVIISDPDHILHDFTIVNNTLFYILRQGMHCRLFAARLNNLKIKKEISLPGEGMGAIGVTPDHKTLSLYINSWITPRMNYLFDPEKENWVINPMYALSKLPKEFNIETKEVWIKARDGVMVPLTLIYHKELKLDGQNPALITGYGSYGDSKFPSLNPLYLIRANQGIVIAIAHVRGGGELGDQWHLAGMKKTKKNTWNDFIDCAEWLINNKYTSAHRLIAEGQSAGGILIGRAVTERPDLFCAAVIEVGVLNASRFAYAPNGKTHYEEFGNPSIEEEFNYLYEMDAYLHLKDSATYPAMYITASWNDARVIAWQPAKFAARLQNNSVSGKPVYLLVDFNAGHFNADPGQVIDKNVFELQQWNYNPYEKSN